MRLVSMRSITASWPTTALRTSPRTASVIVWMLWTSIDDLSLPLVDVAREAHERCGVAPAWHRPIRGFAQHRVAVDLDAAREPDPLQPAGQGGTGKLARSMELDGGVANGFLDVALDHH